MTKYLTKEGLEKIKEELEHLKNIDRKEVVSRIRNAAALGDLKENAGYHAAREDQGFIEEKIKRLTNIVNDVQIVEKKGDKVQIGSTVHLESKNGKDKYQVVEPEEADISTGKISLKSSLGQALWGKNKGDVVSFNTPDGPKQYKITDVE